MANYIDKDAALAEIKKLEKLYCYDSVTTGGCVAKSVFISINDVFKSLEVKEVDLEKEIERVRKTHFINDDFEKATLEGRQITNIAKHFFELGVKVAQKGK